MPSLAYSYISTPNETQISSFPQLRNFLLAKDKKNNSNKSQQRSHVWSSNTDQKHFFLNSGSPKRSMEHKLFVSLAISVNTAERYIKGKAKSP